MAMYATIGAPAINRIPLVTNQAILAIEPDPSVVDAWFLYYAFRHAARRLASYNVQTTQKNVSKAIMERFPIPLPPLEEQRAIAFVLRAVQQTKDATEKVIAALQELKRSLLRHLFTFGPAPVTKTDKVELKETEFGPVPARWVECSLEECADIQTGITKGRHLEGVGIIEVPYLRVANVQDGYIDLSEIKTIEIRHGEVDRYRLRKGDVLLTEGGDLDKLGRGYVWRGEIDICVHQNHIFAVRPHQALLSSEYLAFLIQSPYGKAYFLKVGHRTTNLASINRTKLAGFPVLLPSLDEQRAIVELISGVEAKLAAEQSHREALVRVFNAALRDLMTGKRRVGLPEAPRG